MSVSSSRAVSISTGTGPVGLDAAADLQPVEPGQHDVEHDEVGPHLLGEIDRLGTVASYRDVETLRPQPRRHGFEDRRLVVDHQDPSFDLQHGHDSMQPW